MKKQIIRKSNLLELIVKDLLMEKMMKSQKISKVIIKLLNKILEK